MHFLAGGMRTNVYVDGFNLYYGCLKGTPHKWLDLEALFDRVLPNNTIECIHYFTARVEARPNDPDVAVRQATYLRALSTLPRVRVHYGTFLASPVRAPVLECDANGKPIRQNGKLVVKRKPNGAVQMEWVHKTEEKGSDVNLAAHLLRDALKGVVPCAVVVSNDSDLLMPVHMAQIDGGIVVGLVPPRPQGSAELKRMANFKRDIRPHHLAASQFADVLQDAVGLITKPNTW
ncbi:NYN domain-containing protein [Brevundimonas aurifodinae]|uniref:NYN domain-containing protein n=2 Tax=Brevundimonas TaxID=41275 RepID=A0ABV1NJ82_9CAUL|nr:MAG: hypothetical protein B7Z42_07205 [Brevundimonas sp. 12-68-7]OYX34809.1 MAG: hypothetical protein B7Z01_04525 [Brevundimonas subvibrioides]